MLTLQLLNDRYNASTYMDKRDKSRIILAQYGSDLQGKSYSDIARELGVSRPLVHHVLYPIHGSSQGQPLHKKRPRPMHKKRPKPTYLTKDHLDALNLVAKLFSLEPGDLVEIERFRAGGWGFKIV